MDLTISNAVIHEVIKDEYSIPEISLSKIELDPLSRNIGLLMNKLDDIFQNRVPKRAKLLDDSLFRKSIDSIDSVDSNLLSQSSLLIKRLKGQLKNVSLAKGGYFLFVKYKAIDNFLAVFILRDTKGFISIIQDGHYVLNEVKHLEINKLAMGMRINLDTYNSIEEESRKKRYVSLIRGTTEVSKYFENWVGTHDPKMESVNAKSLMDIASRIGIPDGVNDREDLRRKIGEFASSAPNNTVNLSSLSAFIFGDEFHLARYCSQNDIDIDDEFKISRKNLKKFYNIIVNTDGIRLSFARDKINDSILISDGKVIISSSSLVEEIELQTTNE